MRTLKIMLLVYMHELRETLQLDERRLDCLFPQLEILLKLHRTFLSRLQERRQDTLEPGSDCNYVIHSVADILSDQVFLCVCKVMMNIDSRFWLIKSCSFNSLAADHRFILMSLFSYLIDVMTFSRRRCLYNIYVRSLPCQCHVSAMSVQSEVKL